MVLLRLEPDEVRADDGVQLGLWGGRTQADEWAARAVARLATIAGEQQVLVAEAAGGRQPGDAYRWVPAVFADLADPAASSARVRSATSRGPAGCRHRRRRWCTPCRSRWRSSTPTVSAVRVTGRGMLSAAPAVLRRDGRDERGRRLGRTVAGRGALVGRGARARRAARFQLVTDAGRLVLVVVERQQLAPRRRLRLTAPGAATAVPSVDPRGIPVRVAA